MPPNFRLFSIQPRRASDGGLQADDLDQLSDHRHRVLSVRGELDRPEIGIDGLESDADVSPTALVRRSLAPTKSRSSPAGSVSSGASFDAERTEVLART